MPAILCLEKQTYGSPKANRIKANFRVPQMEVGQEEFDHFFSFSGLCRSLFWSLFLMLLSLLSSLFRQTPFAGLLLRQGDNRPHFLLCRVRTIRVFAPWNLLRPLFFWGDWDLPHFLRLPCIRFASLISKVRPTGFATTSLRDTMDMKLCPGYPRIGVRDILASGSLMFQEHPAPIARCPAHGALL